MGVIAMLQRRLSWSEWRWNLWGTGTGSDRVLEIGTAGTQPRPHQPYRYRAAVRTISRKHSTYAVKAWDEAVPEPPDWDLVVDKDPEDMPSGAVLLVAHHADVTFGNIQVRPLNTPPSGP